MADELSHMNTYVKISAFRSWCNN